MRTKALRFTSQSLTDQEIEKHLTTALLSVDLQNCTLLSDRTLAQLALKTRLNSLRWISNPKATSSGHLFFASHTTLQSLNVSGCDQFTDEACLRHLQSPTLQYLDVSFCDQLTDQAFMKIIAPLQVLNLQGCAQITDKTVRILHSLKTLKHLYLAYNTKVSQAALLSLKKLPFETLKIYR